MENFAVMAMAIRERTGYLYGIKKKKHSILMGFSWYLYNWYNSGLNCGKPWKTMENLGNPFVKSSVYGLSKRDISGI